MEAALSQLKTVHQGRLFTPKTGFSCPHFLSLPVQDNQLKRRVLIRCGHLSRIRCAKEAEKTIMEKKENIEEKEEEELIGMSEKCKEMVGTVELMECLEREAIMGEDEGREASDYNRRALIFDKSSRVFQALKQQTKQS